VTYFDRKRDYEKFKAKMLEKGYEPLEIKWNNDDKDD